MNTHIFISVLFFLVVVVVQAEDPKPCTIPQVNTFTMEYENSLGGLIGERGQIIQDGSNPDLYDLLLVAVALLMSVGVGVLLVLVADV